MGSGRAAIAVEYGVRRAAGTPRSPRARRRDRPVAAGLPASDDADDLDDRQEREQAARQEAKQEEPKHGHTFGCATPARAYRQSLRRCSPETGEPVIAPEYALVDGARAPPPVLVDGAV